ncbi:MAG: hypothetical protein HYX49_13990 [Chloroflexi bacterium]|nr:hypothetical protein [Chloroflexota bacterium]
MTSFRDVELLSAYLDGQLSPSDSIRLESRLSSDPSLRAIMDDLRESRGLLRQLPQRRAPRNFTLTPKMAGIKPPEPRAYPAFRFATVLAAFLFIVTFAVNRLAPAATPALSTAAQPAFGMGGGGAPETAPQEAPATEVPAPFAATLSTPTPEVITSLAPIPTQSADLVAPTESPYAKSAAPETNSGGPAQVPNEAPIPFVWQIGLAIVAVSSGVCAWLIRRASERKFRKKWK